MGDQKVRFHRQARKMSIKKKNTQNYLKLPCRRKWLGPWKLLADDRAFRNFRILRAPYLSTRSLTSKCEAISLSKASENSRNVKINYIQLQTMNKQNPVFDDQTLTIVCMVLLYFIKSNAFERERERESTCVKR